MRLTRRSLIGAVAAAAVLPRASLASPFVLRSGPATLDILGEGQPPTALLGFNGSTPGPELRFRQGEIAEIRFENGTDAPSAIHWHGIRLVNAMDGVPGMTQPLVGPGESFDYSFRPPDAGTYWYHSHHRSWEQVARGLYGPLIIEDRVPPKVDADITVTLDDWRLDEEGRQAEGFGNRHDFSHAGRLGNYAMTLPSQDRVRLGDRIRLRIINAATARVFPVRVTGLDGKIVALDGMGLPTPRVLEDLEIAAAQRVDIIGDVTAAVNFGFVARDSLIDMGGLALDGENPSPATDDIPALQASYITRPSDTPDHRIDIRMEGGAMGGGHAGDDIWAFNGASGMPKAPLLRAEQGETAEFALINETGWPHGIHLHGHHFHELSEDGMLGDLRDTSLVQRGTTRRIRVVLDNPGKWLLHCHMLGHQASGMKTWIEVV